MKRLDSLCRMVIWIRMDWSLVMDLVQRRHNARIGVNTEVRDRLKLTGQVSYVDFYKKRFEL